MILPPNFVSVNEQRHYELPPPKETFYLMSQMGDYLIAQKVALLTIQQEVQNGK